MSMLSLGVNGSLSQISMVLVSVTLLTVVAVLVVRVDDDDDADDELAGVAVASSSLAISRMISLGDFHNTICMHGLLLVRGNNEEIELFTVQETIPIF